jgi:biopolymer transport protein ExbD
MSRRRRYRGPERADPNLTPLLDVVLQLITFFMMLVHFGSRIEGATQQVRLPVAPAALPTAGMGLDRLAVAIDAEGRLLAGGQPVTDADDARWWQAEARRRREGMAAIGSPAAALPTRVILRADRSLPYGTIRRILRTAQDAGFERFSLVVLGEDRR